MMAEAQVPEVDLATGKQRKAAFPAALVLPPSPRLLHQAVLVERTRQCIPRAHTKTRGEVRGGGRKPWRQKGTGRARHGSIRSPLWVGGGAAHGPRAVRRRARLPRAMRLRALAMVLGGKYADGEIWMVPAFSLRQAKTKEALSKLRRLPAPPSRLLLLSSKNPSLSRWRRAVRNLPRVLLKTAAEVTAADLLQRTALIVERPALRELERRLVKLKKGEQASSPASSSAGEGREKQGAEKAGAGRGAGFSKREAAE